MEDKGWVTTESSGWTVKRTPLMNKRVWTTESWCGQ